MCCMQQVKCEIFRRREGGREREALEGQVVRRRSSAHDYNQRKDINKPPREREREREREGRNMEEARVVRPRRCLKFTDMDLLPRWSSSPPKKSYEFEMKFTISPSFSFLARREG